MAHVDIIRESQVSQCVDAEIYIAELALVRGVRGLVTQHSAIGMKALLVVTE